MRLERPGLAALGLLAAASAAVLLSLPAPREDPPAPPAAPTPAPAPGPAPAPAPKPAPVPRPPVAPPPVVPDPRPAPEVVAGLVSRARAFRELAKVQAEFGDEVAAAGLAAGARAVADGRPGILTAGLPGPEFPDRDPDTGLPWRHLGCTLPEGYLTYKGAHDAVVVLAVFAGERPAPAGR